MELLICFNPRLSLNEEVYKEIVTWGDRDASRPDNRRPIPILLKLRVCLNDKRNTCLLALPSPLPPQAGSALRALLPVAPSSPQKEVLWFWSHGCWSARPVPFVRSGLVPVGRATFIGRCPLGLPWRSLGAVCHGGTLLVLLLLLFHLLDDLPDFPLCSLWEQRRVCL